MTELAVIGAGTMGRGIAYAAAVNGLRVRLHDVEATAVRDALASVRRDLDQAVERGKLDADQVEVAAARIRAADSVEEAGEGADCVIEAVVEDITVKRELFARLEQVVAPEGFLATNTSALSITEVMSGLREPARGVGMHFFNPVRAMRLCEIVVGLETAPETVAAAEAVATAMGKQTVRVRDVPGFVTSRVNAVIGNEAFFMLSEGIASAEDIDRALKLGLNHPMGPFELIDLVGLDVRLAVLTELRRSLGEKYRPAPLLEAYVKAGRLGRKVGRGVYRYDADGRKLD